MGVHQKIDRVARRHMTKRLDSSTQFPKIREILHFEGMNGPDGIKRKNPGKDEPWHFIDPNDMTKGDLITVIHDHCINLAAALHTDNHERAAFEAAWLAHAITDGLTPAHHYPLEDKIAELRGGEGMDTRNTKRKKLMLPGPTKRQQLRNNWEFWGAKGLMTTHLNFELGIMTAISTMKFDSLSYDMVDDEDLTLQHFDTEYKKALRRVAEMAMYEEFIVKGWTRHLASETKNVLIPEIIHMVMLGWMTAVSESKR